MSYQITDFHTHFTLTLKWAGENYSCMFYQTCIGFGHTWIFPRCMIPPTVFLKIYSWLKKTRWHNEARVPVGLANIPQVWSRFDFIGRVKHLQTMEEHSEWNWCWDHLPTVLFIHQLALPWGLGLGETLAAGPLGWSCAQPGLLENIMTFFSGFSFILHLAHHLTSLSRSFCRYSAAESIFLLTAHWPASSANCNLSVWWWLGFSRSLT